MSILKTSTRVIARVWPIYLVLAGFVVASDLLSSRIVAAVIQLYIYCIAIHATHNAILTERVDTWGTDALALLARRVSMEFWGLMLLVVLLPLFVGMALAFVVLPDVTAYAQIPLMLCIVVPFWICLSLFGVLIPQRVWLDVNEDQDIPSVQPRSTWFYVGTRLLLWNMIYICLLVAMTAGYVVLRRSGLEEFIPFSETLANFVFSAFGFIAVTLTAAVLSHAFLRKYSLGPQGLIRDI